jgi:hypothetical protein
MKLFLMADTHSETDLIVAAETPEAAYRLWCAWFAEWDKPKTVTVYHLPEPIASVAYGWSALSKTVFKT